MDRVKFYAMLQCVFSDLLIEVLHTWSSTWNIVTDILGLLFETRCHVVFVGIYGIIVVVRVLMLLFTCGVIVIITCCSVTVWVITFLGVGLRKDIVSSIVHGRALIRQVSVVYWHSIIIRGYNTDFCSCMFVVGFRGHLRVHVAARQMSTPSQYRGWTDRTSAVARERCRPGQVAGAGCGEYVKMLGHKVADDFSTTTAAKGRHRSAGLPSVMSNWSVEL